MVAGTWGVAVPAAGGPLRRELQRLRAEGAAVEEELDQVAAGVREHRDRLPLTSRPVPVREEVQDRPGGPLALVEVEGVPRVSRDVHRRGGEADARPERLAEVVDPRPHEVAGEVRVRGDPLPEPLRADHPRRVVGPDDRAVGAEGVAHAAEGADGGNALGADHAPGGVVVAVLLREQLAAHVPAVHVVVADDVESVQELHRGASVVGGDVVVAGRDRPRRVLAADDRHEPLEDRDAFRRILLADLVAGAPEDDGRVVAVAAHEVRQVALRPLGEVPVVALLDLAHGPLVERLGHDQEAHAVAQVEELGGRRVVRGADGVRPHRLQDLEPPFPHPLGHRRADGAAVVVQVHPVHPHTPAVEEEPAVGVVREGPDAKGRHDDVRGARAIPHLGAQRVEGRRLRRPEAGRRHPHGVDEVAPPARGQLERRFRATHFAAGGVEHQRADRPAPRGAAVVLDTGADLDLSAGAVHVWRGDERPPARDVQCIGDRQPGVAVDAAPRVPAGVGLGRVVHADRDDVDPGDEVRRDVVGDGGVAVRPPAEVGAVDPDVGVHVDAVELERHAAAARAGGKAERLAVPAGAGREVAVAPAAGGVLARRPLDAPVVREVEPAPGAIVEPGALGALMVAEGEAPSRVHGEALALSGGGLGGQ